jgi:FkbM family methyltransferase
VRPALERDPTDLLSWQKWSRRLAQSRNAAAQEFAELLTDLRLLTRRWEGGRVVRQKRIDGYRLVVFANEDVGRQIYFFGKYEEEDSAYIRQNVRETDICFDVGANVGYYTLFFSKMAKRGIVYSFEPVPLNYQVLTTNLMLNNIHNVVPNPSAVGSTKKDVDFVVARDGAYSSFVETGRKGVLERIRVPMTGLDEYCQSQHVSRIDVLKVDVEGAEEQVIEGASGLLRDCPPRLVMLELHEPMLHLLGSSIEKVLARMQGFGYFPKVHLKGRTVPFMKEHYNRVPNVFFSKHQ